MSKSGMELVDKITEALFSICEEIDEDRWFECIEHDYKRCGKYEEIKNNKELALKRYKGAIFGAKSFKEKCIDRTFHPETGRFSQSRLSVYEFCMNICEWEIKYLEKNFYHVEYEEYKKLGG